MIGASHGGFLTLEYAVVHPDRVHAILVGDSAAQMSHWALMNAMKTLMTDPRVKPDPERVLRCFSGRMTSLEDLMLGFQSFAPLYEAPEHLKGEAEVDASQIIMAAMVPHYETVNAAMGDCLSRYDLRDRLGDIKVPTFIWVGRYDWLTPVSLSEELHAGIKGSELVVYEKSGHMAALEEKTKFSKDVRAFLGKAGIPGVK